METSLTGKAIDFGSIEYRFESCVSNMYNNSYIFFLSHLKIALARKSYFFDIKLSRQNLPLVRLLKNINVIRRFKKVRDTSFRVYPFFHKKTNLLYQIKVYSNKQSTITINQTSLRLLRLSASSTYIILETPQGLLLHTEAVKEKTGGRLLCVIL